MKNSGRLFWGLLVIFFGISLLLSQFGFGFFLSMFWPLVLVALGVFMLAKKHVTGGIILTLIGLAFLASEIFNWNFFAIFWPAIIIIVGLSILFKGSIWGSVKGLGTAASGIDSDDSFEDFVLFWGLDKRITSKNFKGGKINCFFGGAKLDLREAKIAKSGAEIEINAAFGGVEILVPRDMKVESEGLPVLGGWTNNFVSEVEKGAPVLKISGSVGFGGVEVKN